MKTEILNESQKQKLLEMISKTFTLFKTVKFIDGSCDFCLENTLLLSTEENPRHNNWILSHWLQFTLGPLLTKLAQDLGYEGADDYNYMNEGIPLGVSSIDYLYEVLFPLTKYYKNV